MARRPSAATFERRFSDKARGLPEPLRSAPIYNYLVKQKRLIDFALKVEDLGISTFGDFVEVGEEQIYSRVRTTPKNRQRVRALLASFDL